MDTPNRPDTPDTPNSPDAPNPTAAVTEELRRFLSDNLGTELALDDDYFALGLVNSLFAMELVTFVEKRYGIEIDVEDLDMDNFRTLGGLTDFVTAKTATRDVLT